MSPLRSHVGLNVPLNRFYCFRRSQRYWRTQHCNAHRDQSFLEGEFSVLIYNCSEEPTFNMGDL